MMSATDSTNASHTHIHTRRRHYLHYDVYAMILNRYLTSACVHLYMYNIMSTLLYYTQQIQSKENKNFSLCAYYALSTHIIFTINCVRTHTQTHMLACTRGCSHTHYTYRPQASKRYSTFSLNSCQGPQEGNCFGKETFSQVGCFYLDMSILDPRGHAPSISQTESLQMLRQGLECW